MREGVSLRESVNVREIDRENISIYKIRLFFVHLSDIFSPSSHLLVPCYCFLYRFSDFLFDLTSKITRNRCDPDLAVGWVKIFPVSSRPGSRLGV